METLAEWIVHALPWAREHAVYLAGMLAISSVVLVGSLWIGHRVLISVPPDYFQRKHKPFEAWRATRPALWWTLMISKNLAGGLLIAAGLVMFVTPGQGVLTLVLGLALVDVPGKHRAMRALIERPRVLRLINRVRARADQPPLSFERSRARG